MGTIRTKFPSENGLMISVESWPAMWECICSLVRVPTLKTNWWIKKAWNAIRILPTAGWEKFCAKNSAKNGVWLQRYVCEIACRIFLEVRLTRILHQVGHCLFFPNVQNNSFNMDPNICNPSGLLNFNTTQLLFAFCKCWYLYGGTEQPHWFLDIKSPICPNHVSWSKGVPEAHCSQ